MYNRKNQEIRRLTDETENIWGMKWSPSGEKILYQATVPGPIDSYVFWYVADPKINPPQISYADIAYPYSVKLGWIAENSLLYILWHQGYGRLPDSPKYGSVRYINLENEEIKGTYLISLDGSYIKISDTIYTFFEDQEPFKTFFGLNSNSQMYNISPNGDIRLLGPSMEYATPSISPNKEWFLIFEDNKKIALYSDDFQLQKSWNFDEHIEVSSIKWRPDSLGLIISANGKKYYISIPDGEPQLEPQLSNVYSTNYAWLP